MNTLSEEIDAMVGRLVERTLRNVEFGQSLREQVNLTQWDSDIHEQSAALFARVKSALERNERDAERYHWFRMAFVKDDDMEEFNNAFSDGCDTPEDVDACVDSARAGGEGK